MVLPQQVWLDPPASAHRMGARPDLTIAARETRLLRAATAALVLPRSDACGS
jgi:hypothetical protein